jgi:hypothetical protein
MNFGVGDPSVFEGKNTDLTTQDSLFKVDKNISLSESKNLSVAKTLDNQSQTIENTSFNQRVLREDSVLNKSIDLSFLPLKINLLTLKKPSFEPLNVANAVIKKRKIKTIDWQLGISSGLNTLKMNYLSDSSAAIAALKKETEKGQLGWQSSLHLTALQNDKWRFSTGLTYAQYFSKLDYKQEKTVQVLKKNQLLQVWINTSTGDTLQTRRGDTTVNALSTRQVVHHNSFQQLSIPLTFGIQNQLGNLAYGINAGAVLNFTLAQSGKLIDGKGELSLFSNGDALAPLRKSSIGAQISPFVGYAIAKKWSIECHPQWSWQSNKNIGTTGMKVHIHQFGLTMRSVWSL